MKPAYTYQATVVSIVDGDTVRLDVDAGFNCHFHEKFRLAHVNTPEKTDKDGWLRSTSRVKELLPVGGKCFIKSLGQDKYGRWLAEIFVDGFYVNGALLGEELAVAYEG